MVINKLLHLFIPHPQTHEKAHLLRWHSLLVYILLFLLLRSGFELLNVYKPGVLGVNSNLNAQAIIEDTNRERAKNGLPPVVENSALDQAALAKAKNMFEEDYWAHFSPSGKDPWGFILSSGYKFSYAGENLARNFYNSQDVVTAWMNSPSHRDNILNSRYEEIGIAVVDGVLKGQKTTLVVQMFGKSYQPIAAPQVNIDGQKIAVKPEEVTAPRSLVLSVAAPPKVDPAVVDPYQVTKLVGGLLMGLVGLLIALDYVLLKRRGVFRLSSHHLAHLSFLALGSLSLLWGKIGEIL